MQHLSEITLDRIRIRNGWGLVVRDDLLEGGTKQRAIVPYLKRLKQQGFDEFVYASPFSGFAQVALASALQYIDFKCTVFCEPTLLGEKHRFSALAEKMGATVLLCDDLEDADFRAKQYESQSSGRLQLPLGFNDERYREELSNAVDDLWAKAIAHRSPKNLWLPVGSGTLAQVFRNIVDKNIQLQCVDVHVLKEDDDRIEKLRGLDNLVLRSAPLKFQEECRANCPIPSNLHYDSKVYEVFRDEAEDGDIWWNVAR